MADTSVLVAPPDDSTREPPRRRDRRGLAVFVVATLGTLVVLLIRNSYLLTDRIVADGDFAANDILIDKAKHFELLIGNYSRVGFHHPGPALLYVQAFSAMLLRDAVPILPGSYNAELFGIFALNAVCIGICLRLLWEHGHRYLGLVVAWAAIVLLLSTEPLSALLASSWMPSVYVCPFLLFIMASASLLAGRVRSAWIVVLAGGLLVHGHVSFVNFVVPVGIGLAAWLWWHHRRTAGWWRANRTTFALAVGVLALFVLPMVVDLILHWPGQFGDYWSYARDNAQNRHHVTDAVTFTLSYWSGGRARQAFAVTLALVAAAVISTLALPAGERRRLSFALLAMAGVATVLFLNYAVNGVDDLNYRYVGYFYFAVRATVVAVIGLNLCALLERSTIKAATVVSAVAAAGLVLAAVATPELANPYRGDDRVDQMVAVLRDDPRRAGRTVALRYPVDAWPVGIAVFERGENDGMHACVWGQIWAFMVLPENVCAEGGNDWIVDVVPAGSPTPGPDVVYRDERVTIAPAP